VQRGGEEKEDTNKTEQSDPQQKPCCHPNAPVNGIPGLKLFDSYMALVRQTAALRTLPEYGPVQSESIKWREWKGQKELRKRVIGKRKAKTEESREKNKCRG
jgi:hypothetical protein